MIIFQLMTTLSKRYIGISCLTVCICSQTTNLNLSPEQAWGFGLLTGVAISLVGLVATLFIVRVKQCMTESSFKGFINLLYALGCGAMMGDSMIHILPDAFSNSEVDGKVVSLIVIGAIWIFIMIERSLVVCGITHQHWEDDHCLGHQQEHGQNSQSENNNEYSHQRLPKKNYKQGRSLELKLITNNEGLLTAVGSTDKTSERNEVRQRQQINYQYKIEKQGENWLDRMKGKGPSGYLNIISSFIHNFFDGFALGAGFASRDKNQYISVVIAIFAHEIPREMGDAAILMKNRFDGCQTIFWNAVVNLTSLIGVLVGLGLGSVGENVQIYILSFVAGNFIYIGADIWRNLLKNRDMCQNFLQFLSFFFGVGTMLLVLLAEN